MTAAPEQSGGGPSPSRPARVYWRSFDLLRGLAAVLMVVNHTALFLTPKSAWPLISADVQGVPLSHASPLQWAVLLGGFAPVVFFFVTGLGYGVQAGDTRSKSRFGLMRKALILFAADALMWRAAGHGWGLDFFGFIALSMLLLAGLLRLDRRSAARSVVTAVALLLAILGLRFVAGPVAERFFHVAPGGWLDTVTGRNVDADAKTGVSFPPIPWLVFPLVGFLLGAWLKRYRPWYLSHRAVFVVVSALMAAALTALSVFMVQRGFVLHRWGTMSVSSVVAGLALLAALVAAASAVEDLTGGMKRVVDALSLRGIAAFSVVPLHFLMIAGAEALGWAPTTTATITAAVVVVLVLAMTIAPRFVPLGKWVAARPAVNAWWLAGIAVTVIAIVAVDKSVVHSEAGRRAITALGQLVLCLMLVLPAIAWPRRVREPDPTTNTAAQSM